MGRYIIKVPERDLYVEWSTVVDDALMWGDYFDMSQGGRIDSTRLDRAALRGHSRLDRSPGIEGVVLRLYWWLPIENLGAYLDLLGEDVDGERSDLELDPRFKALVEEPED